MRRRLSGRRLRFERPSPGEKLPRDDGEAVAVARRPCSLATRLLRREIAGCSENRSRASERVEPRRARDPEVRHLDASTLVDQQVPGFDVAVNDAGRVRGVDRRRGVVEPVERLPRRARDARRKTLHERSARDELHHDHRPAVVLGDVEDGHDVGVARESRRRECFVAEPPPERLVLGVARREHFDGDLATELLVGCLVDVGHAAAREQPWLAIARGEVGVGGRHA